MIHEMVGGMYGNVSKLVTHLHHSHLVSDCPVDEGTLHLSAILITPF